MSAYELTEAPDSSGRPELSVIESKQHHDALGVAAEYLAHGLSIGRGIGGLILAREFDRNENYQSWKNAATFAVEALTDWADGRLSRWGRRRQGKPENQRLPFNLNSYVDLAGDKVAVNSVSKAIAKREAANGNWLYARAVGLAADTYIVRDVATTADRIVADAQGIDTGALKSNKLTTLKQDALIAVALSPFAKSPVARAVLGTAFVYTAKEKVEGGIRMHQHFQRQRARRAHKTTE